MWQWLLDQMWKHLQTPLWICLIVVQLATLGLPQCVQYSSPDTTSPLRCSHVFAECDYISPANLSVTEADLANVVNVAKIQVTPDCLLGFISFYCRQVYTICDEGESEEEGLYVPIASDQPLCRGDCERVIDVDCGSDWEYLRNIIEQLRQNAIIATPALMESCLDYGFVQNDSCISLLPDSNATMRCTPTETQTPSMMTNGSSGEFPTAFVLGVSLGVGIPLLSIPFFFVSLMLCCCVRAHTHKDQDRNTEHDQAVREKTDTPDSKGTYNRATLMMRSSAIHSVLLGIGHSPRSGTVAKRLGTKEFLKMSPKQRLQALEFPHDNICILKDLADTNFGKMYLGEATGLRENELSTTVFIKSLKERASSKVREQFAVEMTLVSGFSHPNILPLLGVCNKEEPRYMILEYLEYGSLKEFLHSIDSAWFDFDEALNEEASTCASSSSPMLGIEDLTTICCQVADGMEYLASWSFIHRDLAARNCHVGQGLRVKIASFGLSYDPHSSDYCFINSTKRTIPVPLRWLAPEALQYGRFSVYSDVWAFGVLLWEVFAFGAQPYTDLSNAQVVQNIVQHKVLPRPDKCPDNLYKVMLKCWNSTSNKRPWFSSLTKELRSTLGSADSPSARKYARVPSNPDLLH